ncbi:glutamate--tRNA ligase [Brumimicrobium aurantiacum]|uniref:Glutamate--tRNA ligase n=1 Tax=Brumimicrobium aurantiacum TaxID=1737063 RepID=A0A3E1F248_9FLAO|nr:glutamate--tRNA ligase [Brumimicrobium aurantiacum]RFC55870.1 glutamate--tRNA ligase [Brumimicrobium aurantiacum]
MSDKSVRVRFAPSPTGPLHMGGVRTALYNYLFAKKHNGTFILRVEDTDQTRFVEGAEEYIMEALKWCGITPDEGQGIGGDYGPYKQSERQAIYKPYAEQLIANGKAYYAFDTSEDLDKMRKQAIQMKMPNWQYNSVTRTSMQNSLTLPEDEVQKRLANGDPYVIRFKMPRNEDVRFEDEIRGWVVVNTNNLDDKVLFKSDGMPTYHLANIVDDHTMEISHVIRGEEWLPSAPLHVLLYEAFEWEAPKFAHCPLLLRPDGNGKLSKRDGDRLGFPVFPIDWFTADGEKYSGYREQGYLAGAFTNMLAFLGWNPGTTQEIFSLEEMVEAFSLERVSKAGAKFDADKTKWFQQQYLRAASEKELTNLLREEVGDEIKDISDEYIAQACHLMKERATFVEDIYSEGEYLFKNPTEFDAKTVRKKWKDNAAELITAWREALSKIENFDAVTIEETFKAFLAEKELGIGKVLPLFRLVITGKGMGPSMFEITALLGKEESLQRIDANTPTIVKLKD